MVIQQFEDDLRRENRLRKKLARLGYALRKDRARIRTWDHQGGYMIVDPYRNMVVAGDRFDWNLDDVAAFIEEVEKGTKPRGWG
ncbi:MAG: hypothetical protein JRI66_12335 [Deltaproteobacteria bacterium]|nr:hypothetical protein [Deltaproteobacteria bacterium]